MGAALRIDVRAAMRGLQRDLDDLKRRQIPFASALALTSVAREVALAEAAELKRAFDSPTPFTGRAFGVIPATKKSQTATVFIKDIQAAYLAPYIDGGRQVLGRKAAILTPRDLKTNAYGNIPKGRLQSLKGRPDIFVGEIKTKTGATIGGVWQRVGVTPTGRRRRRTIKASTTGRLKLLIQFTRPATVTHRFAYEAVARKTIATHLAPAWEIAWAKALATAR